MVTPYLECPVSLDWWHGYKIPSLFGLVGDMFAEPFYPQAPGKVKQCAIVRTSQKLNFPFCFVLLLSYPLHRHRPQLYSTINITHAYLHLRVCFLQKPVCDVWLQASRDKLVGKLLALASCQAPYQHSFCWIIIVFILQMKIASDMTCSRVIDCTVKFHISIVEAVSCHIVLSVMISSK